MSALSITTGLVSFLSDNNTTTSGGLSENLNKKISKITYGVKGAHKKLSIPNVFFPALVVEADSQQHDFDSMGNTAQREVKMNLDIVAITNYGMGSGDEGAARENSDKEILQLASNIESFIRSNIKLNNLVDWARVDTAEYSAEVSEDFYNSVAIIGIEATYRSS